MATLCRRPFFPKIHTLLVDSFYSKWKMEKCMLYIESAMLVPKFSIKILLYKVGNRPMCMLNVRSTISVPNVSIKTTFVLHQLSVQNSPRTRGSAKCVESDLFSIYMIFELQLIAIKWVIKMRYMNTHFQIQMHSLLSRKGYAMKEPAS